MRFRAAVAALVLLFFIGFGKPAPAPFLAPQFLVAIGGAMQWSHDAHQSPSRTLSFGIGGFRLDQIERDRTSLVENVVPRQQATDQEGAPEIINFLWPQLHIGEGEHSVVSLARWYWRYAASLLLPYDFPFLSFWKIRDGYGCPKFDIFCWRLPGIPNVWPAPKTSWHHYVLRVIARQISAHLSLPYSSRCNERPRDEDHTQDGHGNFSDPNPEHHSGPIGQILLGCEIAAGFVLFLLGGLLVYQSFYRATDNLILALDDGHKIAWLRFGFWFGACMFGSLVASGIVTYALSVCRTGC